MKKVNHTPRTDEYLETICKLQQTEHPVKLKSISTYLKISSPSVLEMLKRMQNDGLVNMEKGNICLTRKGEKLGKKVIRKHRLSERFLTDFLGLNWSEAHDEACKLEHVLSDKVEESLAKKLGNPQTCPHGHPIPDKNGKIVNKKLIKLDSLKNGDKAIIRQVYEQDTQMLQYLSSLGFLPNVKISIQEIAPFGGPMIIKIGRSNYAIGKKIAERIDVEKI